MWRDVRVMAGRWVQDFGDFWYLVGHGFLNKAELKQSKGTSHHKLILFGDKNRYYQSLS